MTAKKLLDTLVRAGCAPAVDGPDVTFDAEPLPEFDRYLEILLTGVRALLLGKRWCGLDPATGRFLGTRGALDPSAKLPRNVGLLIVEAAGERWDRLSPWVLSDLPECFESERKP